MSTVDAQYWFNMGKMAGERKILELLRHRNYIGVEYEVSKHVEKHNWDLVIIEPPSVPLLNLR